MINIISIQVLSPTMIFASHFNLLFYIHKYLRIQTICWLHLDLKKTKQKKTPFLWGTSYLGQKLISNRARHPWNKKHQNRESVAAQFCSFICRLILFDWICRMSRRRRDSSDEEDGNFKYCDFKIFVMLWKKLQQNKNWRENLQKWWHNSY